MTAIRPFRSADLSGVAQVYRSAIRHIGPRHYSAEQVAAWSSFAGDTAAFSDWVDNATVRVAVDTDDNCIGFGGIDLREAPVGHITALFVAPRAMRRGIGRDLLSTLLAQARAHAVSRLTTAASAFSQPLFAGHGFALATVEHTEFKGVAFERFLMERAI